MAITTNAICDSFKKELLQGKHDFDTSSDTYKLAMYTSSATLGKSTTNYSTNPGGGSNTEGTSANYTAGGGTLSLGVETTSGDTAANEGEAYSVSYSTTMGSAAVAVGYSGYDANSTTSSRTDVTLSQSIGGGASVFAEFQNLTGAGVAAEGNSTSESVVAIGTSVSF